MFFLNKSNTRLIFKHLFDNIKHYRYIRVKYYLVLHFLPILFI